MNKTFIILTDPPEIMIVFLMRYYFLSLNHGNFLILGVKFLESQTKVGCNY